MASRRRSIREQVLAEEIKQATGQEIPAEVVDKAVEAITRKRKPVQSVSALADELVVPPAQARAVIDVVRLRGYRVALPEDDTDLELVKDARLRATQNTYDLITGDELTFGLVSDTHLSSKEHASQALAVAYDEFERRGIQTVLHAGDVVAGIGIYRTQRQDLVHHTFQEQVDNAVENYPRRDGITTLAISGNHDIEGQFGSMGADPVAAIAHQRPDIEYLGAYAAAVNLENGAHMMLVHGRSGGAYAMSYKPQRWVEGLPPGRKPALVAFGHWHVSGFFRHRQVSLMLAGCFEWQTSLLVRLGLQPDVGFWIVKCRLADDASLTGIVPEWVPVYAGREVGGRRGRGRAKVAA